MMAWEHSLLGDLDPARVRPHWLGWAALLAILAGRAWLFDRNERWVESATIPPAVAALALALGGRHLLRWSLPGVAFLFFMLPLPPRVNMVLAGRALAYIRGREYALPQDLTDIALDVLRHRLVLSYEALSDEVTPDVVLNQILSSMPVPDLALQGISRGRLA